MLKIFFLLFIHTINNYFFCFFVNKGDGDITEEQQEPLLSESQDESITVSINPIDIINVDGRSRIISINDDDLDESFTPLLCENDGNEV